MGPRNTACLGHSSYVLYMGTSVVVGRITVGPLVVDPDPAGYQALPSVKVAGPPMGGVASW